MLAGDRSAPPTKLGAVSRAIIHLDMDAFYASVEQRDDPALRGLPVIVGGHPTRGVVLAASYEVRPFGVHSAMPMAQAVRLAPKARVVPPRFEAYAEASAAVFAILESVTPLVEPLSLDEAFLDVTASRALHGDAPGIARKLRQEIADRVHLAASAGIAEVKFAAKIASDLAKPNGQLEVPVGGTRAFLAPLPVSRLWGVGPKTEGVLHGLGLRTIGAIAACEPAWLEERLGSAGPTLWELSRGIDPRAVVPERQAKSIGAEDTFEHDRVGAEALETSIHGQALRVGQRLRLAGLRARSVQLKLKLSDFTLLTRSTTLDRPSDDGQALYRAVRELLDRTPLDRPVRLTGVAAHDLVGPEEPQLALFAEPRVRARPLNAALDAIQKKFGPTAVTTADLTGSDQATDDEVRRKMGASRLIKPRSP
jgi:DNA polymerase IV